MIRFLNLLGLLAFCIGFPMHLKAGPVSSTPAVPHKKSLSTACPAKANTSQATASIAPQVKAKPPVKPPQTALARKWAFVKDSATIQAKRALAARLARVTAYWSGEGDYYTGRGISSTGIRLHGGHCAVDPRIIPYGSVVEIPGIGKYVAVDTGSAVISRTAARMTGKTKEERNALVVDLYFESEREGERFAARGPKYACISWSTPAMIPVALEAKQSRVLATE